MTANASYSAIGRLPAWHRRPGTRLALNTLWNFADIARLESGRTLPSLGTLSRYAAATGSRVVLHLERDSLSF